MLGVVSASSPWLWNAPSTAIVPSAPPTSSVSAYYDIANQEMHVVQNATLYQLSLAMGTSNSSSLLTWYSIIQFDWLSRSVCYNFFRDPITHPPLEAEPFPNVNEPQWASLTDPAGAVSYSALCVSRTNSSLVVNGTLLTGSFVTGVRSNDGSYAYSNTAIGKPLLLWFRGWEYSGAVQLLMAQWSSRLNVSVDAASLGVSPDHQVSLNFVAEFIHSAAVPVCEPMSLTVNGCFNITFGFHADSGLSDYEIKYRTQIWPITFQSGASDPTSRFVVRLPNQVPTGPWFESFAPVLPSSDSWSYRSFPQSIWVKQNPDCVEGVACVSLNIAPSARYFHTTTLYKSWNFERDVLAHANLCKLYPNQNNTACGPDCLTNTSCLAPSGRASAWAMVDYYMQVSNTRFWSYSDWTLDDGSDEPMYDLHDSRCPPACCSYRRTCTRTHDEMGMRVPFDRTYMLVFGGKTKQRKIVDGMDFYFNCETIQSNNPDLDASFNSCLEYQSEELWRYDIIDNRWDLLKPHTGKTASGASMGYPSGRYAHASVMVIIDSRNDQTGTRRVYMFVYGGLGNSCPYGLCKDVWRFEVPWAAKAYWPTGTTVASWERSGIWIRKGDNPTGGLYQHSMQALSSGQEIYVFGGHKPGGWSPAVLQYKVVSDTWTVIQSLGYMYFTRTVFDYSGNQLSRNFTDFSMYREGFESEDVKGPTVPRSLTSKLVQNQPVARGMTAMTSYDVYNPFTKVNDTRLLLTCGFQTYSDPYPGDSFPYPTLPYFLSDTWQFNTAGFVWSQVFFNQLTAAPHARRGATMITIRSPTTRKNQALLFGGHNQDTPYNDLWIYEIEAAPRSARKWRRLDTHISGVSPPATTFHTMIQDTNSGLIAVFGGLSWFAANITQSQALNNIDLRCFKVARELQSQYSDIASALAFVVGGCEIDSNGFCCGSLDAVKTASTRADLSKICKEQCQSQSFSPMFAPIFSEGIWLYNMTKCLNDCSDHGSCVVSNCVCRPGWSGTDCSVQLCPGSTCYNDPMTQQPHCTFCSQHGTCSAAECICDSGWGDIDCSMKKCLDGCSSNGACFQDYPVNQCICNRHYSGEKCDLQLCLHECSGVGSCVNGVCSCPTGYHGPDCSLYVPPASANRSSMLLLALLVLVFLI